MEHNQSLPIEYKINNFQTQLKILLTTKILLFYRRQPFLFSFPLLLLFRFSFFVTLLPVSITISAKQINIALLRLKKKTTLSFYLTHLSSIYITCRDRGRVGGAASASESGSGSGAACAGTSSGSGGGATSGMDSWNKQFTNF